jgi:hypothetical protein
MSSICRYKQARKRRYGGGRKPHLLVIEDKLLFILVYFKVYPLQEVIAACFGMSQGRANEWIHKLSPILEKALGAAQCLSERNPQNLEQVLALCASVDFIIDGTERPVQRPTDASEQKCQYSGKKKHILSKLTLSTPFEIIGLKDADKIALSNKFKKLRHWLLNVGQKQSHRRYRSASGALLE